MEDDKFRSPVGLTLGVFLTVAAVALGVTAVANGGWLRLLWIPAGIFGLFGVAGLAVELSKPK